MRRVYKEGTLLRQIGGLEARPLTLALHSGGSGIIISREALLDSSNWRNSQNCALQHCSSGYGSWLWECCEPSCSLAVAFTSFQSLGEREGLGFLVCSVWPACATIPSEMFQPTSSLEASMPLTSFLQIYIPCMSSKSVKCIEPVSISSKFAQVHPQHLGNSTRTSSPAVCKELAS